MSSRNAERFLKDEARKLIEERLNGAVRYERSFARIAGGAVPGLFLSQAWYWATRTTEKDGWFYKTMAEWTEETGLTRSEQETARKRLEALGLLTSERRGIKGKLHFKVNARALYQALPVCGKPTNRNSENQQTEPSCLRESDISVCGKPAFQNAGNPQTLPYTKTTTETTTVICTSPSAPHPTRINSDWTLPSDWEEDAVSLRDDIDVAYEADKFKDYWIGIPGIKGKKLDWRATWRNWIRNADSNRRARAPDKGRTLEEQYAIEAAAVARMNQ